MTTIAYIRVSSDKQTCSNQHFTIKEYANAHNLIINKWVEETISSRKPLEKRELGKLLCHIGQGDTLIVTEISRLARNLYELAEIYHQDPAYIGAQIRLTFLAPDIIDAILRGAQPKTMTARELLRASIPASWPEQRKLFGFPKV